MTPRSVPEWIGKTTNTPVPERVRLRNFRTHGGICHISKIKIMPGDAWETDHVIAIIDGGENRESNLAPALLSAHKIKTAGEVARKAKVDTVSKKHLGIKSKSTALAGRDRKDIEAAKAQRSAGKIQSCGPTAIQRRFGGTQ
ncbi:MAG: HNH endonuclease [Beijerinckiaceae bacterium]|nr:HNH endonuclease [Beijerinckiaceae bacterium]